ncbi:MAG: endolytic transglycosylase MltG [Thiohalomonadales bacterium]
MRNLYKIAALLVFLGGMVVVWAGSEYLNFAQTPIKVSAQGYVYELKPGFTLTYVARQLAKDGVISNAKYLVWVARLSGRANDIKTGEYLLTADMKPSELLDKINQGGSIQYGFTVIEGWTTEQLIAAVRKDKNLLHVTVGLSNKEIMSKLGLADLHPEGQFLPDTYHFPRGTSDLDFLRRANHALHTFLTEQWEKRDVGLPYKSPYEALIMASIVEKETGAAHERAQIAGVFIRRLEKRMRLQTDPTVIYGLGKSYKGNIKRRHLKQDTPYNTYTRFGLPPTPIALPGRDAILAALHPADGDSLYFVSRGDGTHKFTSNLRDHNNAVIKYQLKGKRRAFSSMKNAKR